MFKKIIFVIRFLLIGWWFIPFAWILALILTGEIKDGNELAYDVFYGISI